MARSLRGDLAISLRGTMSVFNKPITTADGQRNKYLYSFSGADADAFCWFPQAPELLSPLSSVHTISVSVHESKGQARALGYRGIKGLARGVRTIAGSLILTVINDHPLRELQEQYVDAFVKGDYPEPNMGWSLDRHRVGVGSLWANYDYSNRLAVLLPPFNLAVQYVSEMGKQWDPTKGQRAEGAGWMLEGVEFLDEGQVTSVNDIVTEMTFSFIACDFKPFTYYDIDSSEEAQTYLANEGEQQHDSVMSGLAQEQGFIPVGISGEIDGYLPGRKKY